MLLSEHFELSFACFLDLFCTELDECWRGGDLGNISYLTYAVLVGLSNVPWQGSTNQISE